MFRAGTRSPTVERRNVTFHWDAFDQFPHPTYKGGTAEESGAFAEVLAAFFERGDNFDFLARMSFLRPRFLYIFPSGQEGLRTSFEELAIHLLLGHGVRCPSPPRRASASRRWRRGFASP